MRTNSRQKLVRGIIWGAVFSIVATTALTIGGEIYAPLKSWLTATFSHHWLGKSILSVAVFALTALVAGLISAPSDEESRDEDKVACLLWTLFTVTIIATALLIGFYLYEYFK